MRASWRVTRRASSPAAMATTAAISVTEPRRSNADMPRIVGPHSGAPAGGARVGRDRTGRHRVGGDLPTAQFASANADEFAGSSQMTV